MPILMEEYQTWRPCGLLQWQTDSSDERSIHLHNMWLISTGAFYEEKTVPSPSALCGGHVRRSRPTFSAE